jgi:hypothetical protein
MLSGAIQTRAFSERSQVASRCAVNRSRSSRLVYEMKRVGRARTITLSEPVLTSPL